MQTEYPALSKGEGDNMLQLLFNSFDTDMSNSIDIEEFSIGIGKLTKGWVASRGQPMVVVGLVVPQLPANVSTVYGCPPRYCGVRSMEEKLELLFQVRARR